MPDGDGQDPDSDEALMLAYAAGSLQAFDRLYARHRQPLFRYLMRHTRQRELAHDLFQEAWGKLVDARLRYEPRARFQTFPVHDRAPLPHRSLPAQCRAARDSCDTGGWRRDRLAGCRGGRPGA
jgi:RNA polymerase sigma-70 factor (ECF subfamily)